jgi:hypothetical protein
MRLSSHCGSRRGGLVSGVVTHQLVATPRLESGRRHRQAGKTAWLAHQSRAQEPSVRDRQVTLRQRDDALLLTRFEG